MKQTKLWVGLLAVTLAALVFWRTGAHDFVRETLYPYQKACVWFERAVWLRARAMFSRSRLAARNAMLERDVARLRMVADDVEALEAETRRLRALLDFVPPVPCRWLAAPILSRGGASAVWQQVRLGKGSLHGVRKGAPVVVPDGVVGRVMDVSLHTSDVMLITDPNSRVACELETPGEGVGVVRGILYGGGSVPAAGPELTLLYVVEPLRLRYLARDFEPSPHTRVVTSGLGQTFPKGLTVGFLLDSRIEPNALSREAAVMPAVDFAALDEVFVLSPGGTHAP